MAMMGFCGGGAITLAAGVFRDRIRVCGRAACAVSGRSPTARSDAWKWTSIRRMEPTTEQRRFRRVNVLDAVVVAPNGHGHGTQVLDVSLGGARVALPSDWMPLDGSALKVFFLPETESPIVLHAHVTRVANDHLGVSFDAAQDDAVHYLLHMLGEPG